MEPYALIPGAGPFAASADLFTTLVEELRAPDAAGLTACELEDLLTERGREVQRQLLQDHLDLRAAREEQAARQHHPSATGADGITRSHLETGHGRLLASLFGTVQVTRCAWRRAGAPNLYPADAALSLPAPRCSHALARLAAAEAARGSFEAAHAAITRRCGPVIGKRQVEQAAVSAAADIAAFYAARVPVPATAPTLLVISADAKGIVMRPGALRPATATWVVLVDGAEHQLDLIRSEARRRGVTIHIVIDLIHVLEYIWKAAWCLHAAGDPAAEDWVAVKALAVLAGDSARAAAQITAEADTAGLAGAQRNGTDACVRCLTSKDEYLRYDQALAAGWPIATGVIEGACRHLIGDRLDITGARWGLQGAEAILTLRAVIANGDYDEYWRYHLVQEHQRLYPGTAQGQYTLSV